MVAPVTWQDELDGAQWVHPAVVGDMDDVWGRALSVSEGPLEYVGSGASAVVLLDGKRVLKVARKRHPVYYSLLETEGELLQDAHAIDPAHVVKPHAFLADPIILVKDYVEGRPFGWAPTVVHDHFRELASALEKINWGPPEFKDDSYVRTEAGGFVLVDGGHAARLCGRLVRWVEDWLDGARHPWTIGGLDKQFLSFLVRREIQVGCVKENAPVLARLGDYEPNAPSYVSWIVYEAGREGTVREWEPATYQAAQQMFEMFRFQTRHEPGRSFGYRRSRKKPVLELRDGIVQRIKKKQRPEPRVDDSDRALCGCTADDACDVCRATGKKWP